MNQKIVNQSENRFWTRFPQLFNYIALRPRSFSSLRPSAVMGTFWRSMYFTFGNASSSGQQMTSFPEMCPFLWLVQVRDPWMMRVLSLYVDAYVDSHWNPLVEVWKGEVMSHPKGAVGWTRRNPLKTKSIFLSHGKKLLMGFLHYLFGWKHQW